MAAVAGRNGQSPPGAHPDSDGFRARQTGATTAGAQLRYPTVLRRGAAAAPTRSWVLTAKACGQEPTVVTTTDAGARWRPVLDPTGLRAIAGGTLAWGADGVVGLLLNCPPSMKQMAYAVFLRTDGQHTAAAGGHSAGSAL